jgi:hypothetical protein
MRGVPNLATMPSAFEIGQRGGFGIFDGNFHSTLGGVLFPPF